MPKKPPAKKRGPKPQRLKIHATFEEATRTLLSAKKPPGGWPKLPKPQPGEHSEEE